MLNVLDAAEAVSGLAVAVSVRPVPAVLIVIEPKVATPFTVFAVLPAIAPEDTPSVTGRPLSVDTKLPNWSWTWTVTAA